MVSAYAFGVGGPIVGLLITAAVLKWRVGAVERAAERSTDRLTALIEKIFVKNETDERANAREHRDFAVAISSIKSTHDSIEILTDALFDFMRRNGHETDRYRRRRERNQDPNRNQEGV